MDENEERYMQLLQKQLEEEQIKRLNVQNEYGQMSAFPPTKEPNLVEYQLDLKEELDRIHHLLSGHILGKDKDGNEVWIEPADDRLRIFSEYGVKQIMNIIQFYINRNTLLSNYDDPTIKWKVRDFGIELSDLIFNRYEVFFFYPSPEDLYKKYAPLLRQTNLTITELELYQKCIQWSKEELQSKLRHFPMIILSLVDTVHSTYLRALNGEERDSLRKFMHISQMANTNQMGMQMPTKNFSPFKPSTWK